VIQTAQTRRNASNWVADVGAPQLSTERVELAEAVPVTGLSPDIATAMANLVGLEQGLYALGIGEAAGQSGQISGLSVPAVQVSVPPSDRDRCVEIIGTSSSGEAWFWHDGGTVIVKSPPGGGHVLVTAYGLPGQIVLVPRV